MHLNIEKLIGQLTVDQTRELALAALIELNDDVQIEVIKELVLQDRVFLDELMAHLEEL